MAVGSPARFRVRYREKMRKYQAVSRLNNSNSDLSTLDLSSSSRLAEEGGGGGGQLLLADSAHIYYTLDSRRMANKQKKSLRERRLLTGVKMFNLEPERGLHYLEEAGFFSHTPPAVAKFLFRQERLSKKQIGEHVGAHCRYRVGLRIRSDPDLFAGSGSFPTDPDPSLVI